MPVSTFRRTVFQVLAAAIALTFVAVAQAHAAGSSFEAEAMTRSNSNVRISNDSTASGAHALLFTGQSNASTTKSLPAAGGLELRARGDQCQGAPAMLVTVDGRQVGSVSVPSASWANYTVSANLPAGSHKVTVAYANDKYVKGQCDRNLRLDKISVTNAVTSPVPPSNQNPMPQPQPQPAPQPQPQPAPAPTPPPAPSGFTVGMVSGPAAAWEAGLTDAGNLHPKLVRVPFQIGTSVSMVQNAVGALAAKGEQALLMAEFYGTIPSTSQAQSLADWAHAVGPGGTFWQGRSDGNMAVRDIEFGNETNESYQFNGVSSGPSYTTRAQSYALRAKDATDAIASSRGNPGVGLLVQGDNGGCGCSQWVDGMFSAVPDLNRRIAGWTIHPYGPKSRYGPIMDQAVRDTAKHGDTTLPFFITEYGISTNNGQCLDSNYNWPTCLTYQQAADDLHGTIADMHQTYGSRLAALLIFEQRDMGTDGGAREDNFGALKSDGSQKGAFTNEIRSELDAYRG